MKTILLTNDDGIQSEGFLRLAKAAREFGNLVIVAPDGQRSAASHSITIDRPVEIYPYPFPLPDVTAYACTGTPCDCVRAAIKHLLPAPPDALFSGINYGYNVAMDLQYSATAGAAFEASFLGVHAIAFSEGAKPCHEVADAYLRDLIAELLEKPLPEGHIWNVNFPYCPLSECRGVLYDRTVSRKTFFNDSYDEQEKPEKGGVRLMVRGRFTEEAEEGTDLLAVHEHYVSVGMVSNVGVSG